MKRAPLWRLLILAAVYAPTGLPSAYAGNLDEVHSVVVDMPQTISLSHASPDTWDNLPAPVEPDELPATVAGTQLAMSFY